MRADEPSRGEARTWITSGFRIVEDVTYVGLGLLLACLALGLLVSIAIHITQGLVAGPFSSHVTDMLDRILLTLLTAELLYTVQVSFREHAIVPEPFLLVGLIAAIRRILLLTAEYGELHDKTDTLFKAFVTELAVLTVLIVALVASLVLLRKSGPPFRAERA